MARKKRTKSEVFTEEFVAKITLLGYEDELSKMIEIIERYKTQRAQAVEALTVVTRQRNEAHVELFHARRTLVRGAVLATVLAIAVVIVTVAIMVFR